MSRTEKGKKGPGFELWSKRPNKLNFPGAGRFAKKLTIRAERRQGKRLSEV